MKRPTALGVTGLLTLAAAPDAFAWGAYHGGYGGASYHGSFGGSWSHCAGSTSPTSAL
jgi:hypothetical protein